MRVRSELKTTTTSARDIRVVIADDHPILRAGMRAIMEVQPGLHIVGEASDGQCAWSLCRDLEPDVLVLDLSTPGMSGTEIVERLRATSRTVRVLILTMHEERGYVSRLLRAGIAGYLLRRTAHTELVRAIRIVAEGGSYVDAALAGALLTETAQRRGRGMNSALTTREAEVLRLIARGYSNKEVAVALDISVKTVETHKASAMARLGLVSRAALVGFAVDEGWFRTE